MDHLFWYPGYEPALANIVRADNCHLYDAQGRRYLDLESGVWCTAIGHGHPRILRVLSEQAARNMHTGFSFSNPIVDEAAQGILSLHGFAGGKCVFLCSGSEAVEYGVRVVQSIHHRPMLMTMADSYLGAYGAASIKREEEWFSFDWMACNNCQHPDDCSRRCELWASIPFDQIGGFLFEPGSSAGLVRFPPAKLIRSIAAAIKVGGGLIMVNEVTTGVGRTGKWFGYQHYDLSPDIVAMGKGIGSGYPVSVTAFSPCVVQQMGGEVIKYAQSHQNDPLGAAVVLEVIRTIHEEGLIERGRQMAAVLIDGLKNIKERSRQILAIRARGLMVALELADDAQASYTTAVQQTLLGDGYILAQRPGLNVLRLDPSLTIEKADIVNFLETFEKVLMNNAA